jgi:hypothetical protein
MWPFELAFAIVYPFYWRLPTQADSDRPNLRLGSRTFKLGNILPQKPLAVGSVSFSMFDTSTTSTSLTLSSSHVVVGERALSGARAGGRKGG